MEVIESIGICIVVLCFIIFAIFLFKKLGGKENGRK